MKKLLLLFLAIGVAACTPTPATSGIVQANIPPAETQTEAASGQEVAMKFEITSSAFENGKSIPEKYSCKGQDFSPALTWSEPPAGAQSFALIMDDPDAPVGTWVHWVIFNIPASSRGLSEDAPTDPQLSDGSLQGITSARTTGYHGPCPPSGTHRYFFKLYALDTMLSLSSNADKKALLAAMEGHILANAELMGTFSR